MNCRLTRGVGKSHCGGIVGQLQQAGGGSVRLLLVT
jgi:hypothetical protein